MPDKICPQCNQKFTCGIADGESICWCFDLPNIIPLDEISNTSSDCLCPQCLQDKIDVLSKAEQALSTDETAE